MDLSGILHKHFIGHPVIKLGTTDVISLPPNAQVDEAVAILRTNNCGSVIIVNEHDDIVGILTERDLVLKLTENKLNQTVDKFMTADPEVIRKNASIARALHSLSIGGFRHLPIVHYNKHIEGILSVTDVVHFVYAHFTKQHEKMECDAIGEDDAIGKYFCSSIDIFKPKLPKQVKMGTSLSEVIELLREEKIGSVLVTDPADRLVGIFTERDFIKKVAGKSLGWKGTKIDTLMVDNLTTITPQTTVYEAYNILNGGGFRHLPIVDEDERATGVLSVKNFLDRLVQGIISDLEQRASED